MAEMAPSHPKSRDDVNSMDREVLLHGWVKQGVLVLALFYGFPTGDSRSSYFDREFFYRESDLMSPSA